MRHQSSECSACSQIKWTTAVGWIRTAVVLVAMGWGTAAGISQSAAQGIEVAYIASVSGRVVALSSGTPVLLDTLDPVRDRTRLDLQANSELVVCHYGTQRLFTLRGPLRAWISADGVTVETSKMLDPSKGPCAAPIVSNHQGGLMARGIAAHEGGSLRRNFLGK
jgi:hypothetical protein